MWWLDVIIDVDGVEVAVTQAVASWQFCEAAEQDLLSRFVEKLGTGDVCRQS